ncbi:MAG: hypothetical protein IJX99_05615 [Clostridia bacterium]|nr:hypothetical protein [Clostridia bacterium]
MTALKDTYFACYHAKHEDLAKKYDQLKAGNETLFKAIEEVNKINKRLNADNEKLKKEIRLYDCIDKWGTEQCRCACRCLGNEFCDAAKEKMKNIKKTLENIKEIAKKTLNMVDYKTYFKRDNKSLKQEGFKALNEILQKISEVEK